MLRGKIFEKNEEIRIGGQICPLPVCLGLIHFVHLEDFAHNQIESKFFHMLQEKIFERNEEIRFGGQICPPQVCLGLRYYD